MPVTAPNVRDVLNEAADAVARSRNLSPRQAKAYVHDKMSFGELIPFYENLVQNGR